MTQTQPTHRLIGSSEPMQQLLRMLERIAPTRATVLLRGDSGTGKALLAEAIHAASPWAAGPFVTVDCTNIPANLMESEVFGHEAGAFTDARQAKPGLIELGAGGTVLLDEISLLPVELQAKLLGVLETRRFRRLGGTQEHEVDTRFLAATNDDLMRSVEEGRFREDLYHRLNVVPMEVPPLRERGDDVLQIAEHFLAEYTQRHGVGPRQLGQSAILLLRAYEWPGNVRELRNVVQRLVVTSEGATIRPSHLGDVLGEHVVAAAPGTGAPGETVSLALGSSLEQMEAEMIRHTLERVTSNRREAAAVLGISVRSLQYKIKRYGLS